MPHACQTGTAAATSLLGGGGRGAAGGGAGGLPAETAVITEKITAAGLQVPCCFEKGLFLPVQIPIHR